LAHPGEANASDITKLIFESSTLLLHGNPSHGRHQAIRGYEKDPGTKRGVLSGIDGNNHRLMECLIPSPFDKDAPSPTRVHPLANSASVILQPSRLARIQPLQVVETCERGAQCEVTELKKSHLRIDEKRLAPLSFYPTLQGKQRLRGYRRPTTGLKPNPQGSITS
jgi:hypothetical protein